MSLAQWDFRLAWISIPWSAKIVDSGACAQTANESTNERTRIDTSISAYGRLRESPIRWKTLMTNFVRRKLLPWEQSKVPMKVWFLQQRLPKRSLANMPSMCCSFAQSHKVFLDVLSEDTAWSSKLQISLRQELDVQVSDRSKLIEAVRGINGADKTQAFVLLSSMMLKARDLSLLLISLVLTNKSISMSIPTLQTP